MGIISFEFWCLTTINSTKESQNAFVGITLSVMLGYLHHFEKYHIIDQGLPCYFYFLSIITWISLQQYRLKWWLSVNPSPLYSYRVIHLFKAHVAEIRNFKVLDFQKLIAYLSICELLSFLWIFTLKLIWISFRVSLDISSGDLREFCLECLFHSLQMCQAVTLNKASAASHKWYLLWSSVWSSYWYLPLWRHHSSYSGLLNKWIYPHP